MSPLLEISQVVASFYSIACNQFVFTEGVWQQWSVVVGVTILMARSPDGKTFICFHLLLMALMGKLTASDNSSSKLACSDVLWRNSRKCGESHQSQSLPAAEPAMLG